MGRQINYYMDLGSFKLIVKKAFELGFIIIEGQKDFKLYERFDEIPFEKNETYFYLAEAGQLIVSEYGYINPAENPVIEASYSYIDEEKREISRARLWVSTGFWVNDNEFKYRDNTIDKKYSALARYVKKIAPYQEIEVKAINPLFDGKKFVRKEYITPNILEKIKKNEYDCI